MEWFCKKSERLTLRIYVQPGAKHSAVSGLHGDALKIRLAAPAIEGRANEALLHYLALLFKVPVREISLKKGSKSRHKVVEIRTSKIDPVVILSELKDFPSD
jgi:uncharacterized protein